MFDIGFLELFVIGIIALIVLGPERLPKAARAVGLWVGKAKQGFNSVKTEIDRELKVQELRQQIEQQKAEFEQQIELNAMKEDLADSQNSVEELAKDFKAPLSQKHNSSSENKNNTENN